MTQQQIHRQKNTHTIQTNRTHLPTDPTGQILDDEPVFGARWRPIPIPRSHIGFAAPWWTSAAATPQIRALRYATGPLHRHTFPKQFAPIQFVYGVVGITMIVEFDKCETILHRDFAYFAILAKETLQIAFTHPVG